MCSFSGMVLVGWLLAAGLLISFIGTGTAYRSGGYTGRFWAAPLDEKLDHVDTHRLQWWWLSVGSIAGLAVMTAGVAGLTSLLAADGQGPLAWSAFGTYLFALISWIIGLIAQTATLPIAATEQAESGITPMWMRGVWAMGYLSEAIWVIVGNLAYVLVGLAILQTGLLPGWSGWVAIAAGSATPIIVVITRNGFPELVQIVPFVLGIVILTLG